MAVYLGLFGLIFILISRKEIGSKAIPLIFGILFIFCASRSGVGGDWDTYSDLYHSVKTVNLYGPDMLFYYFIWLINAIGLPYQGFIAVCSAIFTFSLYRFFQCRKLDLSVLLILSLWLILLLPLGYIKQSLAISFFLLALSNDKKFRFVDALMVVLGIGFHTSAILVLPLFIAGIFRRVDFLWFGALLGLGLMFWVVDNIELLAMVYSRTSHLTVIVESHGASIRLLYLAFFSLVVLIFRLSLVPYHKLFYVERIEILGCYALLFFWFFEFFMSSVATDRFSFFLLPLLMGQLGAFIRDSRHVSIFKDGFVSIRYSICLSLVGIIMSVGWLLFGLHSKYWMPYVFVFERGLSY